MPDRVTNVLRVPIFPQGQVSSLDDLGSPRALTSNGVAVSGDEILMTVMGAVALPAIPSEGAYVTITAANGSVTVTPGSETIDGVNAASVLASGETEKFVYTSGNWVRVNRGGSTTPSANDHVIFNTLPILP